MRLHHCLYIFVIILHIVPLIERPKSAISSVDLTRNSAADKCANKDVIYIVPRSKSTWSKFFISNWWSDQFFPCYFMIFLNASMFLLDRYASFWSYIYSDLDNSRKLYIYIGSRTFIGISDPAYFYYTFVIHYVYMVSFTKQPLQYSRF